MDRTTVQKLAKLNEDFYRANAVSFSQTRQHAWPGWQRVVGSLSTVSFTVLDVACGNARFKKYVDGIYGKDAIRYYGVDSCPDLIPQGLDMNFQNLDIVDELLSDSLTASIEAPTCNLVACFGFMHHVPTTKLRMSLMEALIDKTVEGGMLAVSFWQFAHDVKMLSKARITTQQGCAELDLELDDGDYLLGWEDKPSSYRYCHSFIDDELDTIVANCKDSAVLVDRFKADGKTGQMNGYLVFRKS